MVSTLISPKDFYLSSSCHIFKKGSKAVIYNAVNLEKIFCSIELAEFIQKFRNGANIKEVLINYSSQEIEKILNFVHECVKADVLVNCRSNENKYSELMKSLNQRINKIRSLKLLVTTKCNFSCTYCQIERNLTTTSKNISMTIETASMALKIFNKLSEEQNNTTVIITGGEPLLNVKTVKHIVSKVPETLTGRSNIVLFTNGSIVTTQFAKFLADNNVLVLVSLDNNENKGERLDNASKQTAETALHGYERYKEAGCRVGISTVMNQKNFDNIDKGIIDHFMGLEPESMGINYCHYILGEKNSDTLPMDLYIEKLLEVYKKAKEKKLFIEQISRVIKPFASNVPRLIECSAYGTGITIDPRGFVGACKVPLINNNKGIPIDSIDLENGIRFPGWTGRSPLYLEGCRDCYCIGVCGGGCAYDSLCLYNDITNVDPRTCIFTKGIFEFLIWDLYRILEETTSNLTEPFSFIKPSIEQQMHMYPEYFKNETSLQQSIGH